LGRIGQLLAGSIVLAVADQLVVQENIQLVRGMNGRHET
jgi:hypothetical protein